MSAAANDAENQFPSPRWQGSTLLKRAPTRRRSHCGIGVVREWQSRLSRLRSRAGLVSILSNSGWMMGEQVLNRVLGLLVGVWVARQLGPSTFGQLSFAMAFASLFGICATLGLNRIVVRELVKCEGDQRLTRRLMSTVFAMRAAAAMAMFVLCVALSWTLHQGDAVLVGIIAAGLVFNASDCIEQYFQSRLQSRRTSTARSVSSLLTAAVKIALLLGGAGVLAFAFAALLEIALAAVGMQWVYRTHGPGFRRTAVDWSFARDLIGESWPEIIAGAGAMILMRMDQIMLQNLDGPAAVGVFSVAAKLSEAWYFIPIAVVASTFPNIVRQRELDRTLYMVRIQQLMTGLAFLGYVAILLATFLAEPLISSLYGPAYAASAPILVIHIWCGLLISLGLASGSWIMAEQRVKLNLYRNLLGAVANIALNLAWIPLYGPRGAAYATLLSLAVTYIGFDLLVPGMRPMLAPKLRALTLWPRRR